MNNKKAIAVKLYTHRQVGRMVERLELAKGRHVTMGEAVDLAIAHIKPIESLGMLGMLDPFGWRKLLTAMEGLSETRGSRARASYCDKIQPIVVSGHTHKEIRRIAENLSRDKGKFVSMSAAVELAVEHLGLIESFEVLRELDCFEMHALIQAIEVLAVKE